MEEIKNSVSRNTNHFLVLSTYKSKYGEYSYGQSKLFEYFGSIKLLILEVFLIIGFYMNLRIVSHFQENSIVVPNFNVYVDYPVISYITLIILGGLVPLIVGILIFGGYIRNIKIIEYTLKFLKGFFFIVHKLVYIVTIGTIGYLLYIMGGFIIDRINNIYIGNNLMVVVAAMLLIMFFFIMFILFLKTLRSVIDDFIVNATSSVDDEYAKVPVSNDLSTYIVIIAAFTLIYYTMSLMTFQDITDLMNLPNIIRNMYGAHFILDVTILIYSAFFIGGFGPFLKKRK